MTDVSRRLRIAVTADPDLPVPPRHYGGAERIVHLLVEGLHARGHDVTLFAHPESRVSCRLIPYSGASCDSPVDIVRNGTTIARHVLGGRFDLIHSYGRLATLMPLAFSSMPKIMSYGRTVTPRSITLARRIFGRSIEFTACARHMIAPVQALAPWHVIYNAVPFDTYALNPHVDRDAPLVFLGRLEHIKAPHLAIDVAKRANRSIVLAGNIPADHQEYFDREVKPLVDGVRVKYIGPVDDQQKNALLGSAAAFLMPILWNEPFGMVMAEALACGTPVIGFNRASVPEIVDDGVTGFVVPDGDVEAMAAAVARIDTIDRRACRSAFERRFSDRVIVSDYESLYWTTVGQPSLGTATQRA